MACHQLQISRHGVSGHWHMTISHCHHRRTYCFRLFDIWTAACVSSNGLVLLATRLDLIIWQIPSPIAIPLSLCKNTHSVIHRWRGIPLHFGISQSKKSYWTSSSISKKGSFLNPMRILEDAIPNEFVPDNTVQLNNHIRKNVEVKDKVSLSLTIVADRASYGGSIILKANI